jgi:hypothetical protein
MDNIPRKSGLQVDSARILRGGIINMSNLKFDTG